MTGKVTACAPPNRSLPREKKASGKREGYVSVFQGVSKSQQSPFKAE